MTPFAKISSYFPFQLYFTCRFQQFGNASTLTFLLLAVRGGAWPRHPPSAGFTLVSALQMVIDKPAAGLLTAWCGPSAKMLWLSPCFVFWLAAIQECCILGWDKVEEVWDIEDIRLDEGAEFVVPSRHRDTFLFASHAHSSVAVCQGKYYHGSVFLSAL